MIRLFVPGLPVGKGRPRMTRAGHCYTPSKTLDYEQKVAMAGLLGMEGKLPLSGPVKLFVTAVFPVPMSWSRKRRAQALWHMSAPDADNILKALADGLNRICWLDDRQICDIRILKFFSADPEKIGVSLEIEEAI